MLESSVVPSAAADGVDPVQLADHSSAYNEAFEKSTTHLSKLDLNGASCVSDLNVDQVFRWL